jgi:UDP-N-acetylmuramate--alanine ligase
MKSVHLIGIGGTGLSAIARILLERGYTVSGSDRVLSPLARSLEGLGARLYEGHSPRNIASADLVIRSSAIQDDNPEVQAALAAGIPVVKRSDFLAELIAGQECVAVAGTHGKTTTTAMLAWTLTRLGQDPSYIIGGVPHNLGQNAHAGGGRHFVIEADEYDLMFLGLAPRWAVVTIVEHDHPDCFPTPSDYRDAFIAFTHKIVPGGALFVSLDDAGAASLASTAPAGIRTFTYGMHERASYSARELVSNPQGGLDFTLWFNSPATGLTPLVLVSLQVPGEHNVHNATAVLAVLHQMHLPLDQAAAALQEFSGTGRRFDLRGEASGVIIINDYAHHPTEIRTTLAAARQRYPGRRIWAVWQPHTYSRTQALLEAFAAAFKDADQVIVTEVFAAREHNTAFSSLQVVQRMDHPGARFSPTLEDTVQRLISDVRPGDVVLVLSAGDADQVSEQLFNELKRREEVHHG